MGAQRDKYKELRAQGVPQEEALAIARQIPKSSSQVAQEADAAGMVSPTRSAALGAAQGATVGFLDEGLGMMRALGLAESPSAGQIVFNPEMVAPGPKDLEQVRREYKSTRDVVRSASQEAYEQNPGAYLGGQVVGGVGAALLSGAPVLEGVKGAAKTGAVYGAATGLGESEAETIPGQLASAGAGAALGVATAPVGYYATKGVVSGVRGAANRLSNLAHGVPKAEAQIQRVAEKTARGVAERAGQPSEIGGGVMTIGETAQRAEDVERRVMQNTGEELLLRPSQRTGDRGAAIAEDFAMSVGDTAHEMQAAASRQVRVAEQSLNAEIQRLRPPGTPAGKLAVSRELQETATNAEKALFAQRTAAAKPHYDNMKAFVSDAEIMPTKPIHEAFSVIEYEKPGSAVAKKLRSKITEMVGESEYSQLNGMRGLRSYLTDLMAGRERISSKVSVQQQRWAASQMLDAVEKSFDGAVDVLDSMGNSSQAKAAVAEMRAGNQAWREHSEVIKNRITDTVKNVIGGKGDKEETLVDMLMRTGKDSDEAIRKAFELFDDPKIGNPVAARAARAQFFEELLTKGGLPKKAATFSKELGVSKLRPGGALKNLSDNESWLQAAYAHDGESRLALKESMALLQRLAFSHGVKGSITATRGAQALGEAAVQIAGATPSIEAQAAAKGYGALKRFMDAISGSSKAQARTWSSREGLLAFRDALRTLANSKAKPQLGPREIMITLTRLGVPAAIHESQQEQQDETIQREAIAARKESRF